MEYLEPVPGDFTWAAAGLPFGSVGWLVPHSERFGAFTRLFHPVSGGGGPGPRWRDLARARGAVWHPEIQFSALVDAAAPERARWGDLGRERLRRIMRHAIEEAGGDIACVAALSDIDTWDSPVPGDPRGGRWVGVSAEAIDAAGRLIRPPPAQRVYRLFRLRASDVADFGTSNPRGWVSHRQPTLVIAADHSFCLATDPDYDSTILAGGKGLQAAVLRDDALESIAIDRAASLLYDADRINTPPPNPAL